MFKEFIGFFIDAFGNTCSLDNPAVPVIWACDPLEQNSMFESDSNFGMMDNSYDSMSCASFDF